MSANLNYTGRVDIDPSDFDGSIDPIDDHYEANVAWRLGSYEFDADAHIQLHIGTVYEKMIVDLGKVLTGTGSKTVDLSQLRKPLEATMTLKVVQKDDNNIPLNRGWLSNFRPVILGNDGSGKSLLETQSTSDLDVIWRVSTDLGRPILQITNREDLYTSLLNDEIFDSIVLPAVIEEIFHWLIWSEDIDDVDPEISSKWQEFFLSLDLPEGTFDEFMQDKPSPETLAKSRELGQKMAEKFSQKAKLIAVAAKKYEDQIER